MLADNIHALRRQRGLSQEQLAEALGVSRQAISKWENNTAVPELDRLQAMAVFFDVSLDELTSNQPPSVQDRKSALPFLPKLGITLCLLGAAALLVLSAVMFFSPPSAEALNTSSTVTINGSGLAMLLSAAVMVLGLLLVLRKK